MKTKTLSLTLLAAGLMFGGVTQSFADHKSYAASECERWNERGDPETYLSWSRRFNPSTTQKLRLDCPSVKDRYANVASSWIRVIDRSPIDRVCARFVAFRQFGSSSVARQGPARCTGIGFNSTGPIQLNTGGLAGVPWDAHYYHSVYSIPKRWAGRDSGVVTYFVNEFNGND